MYLTGFVAFVALARLRIRRGWGKDLTVGDIDDLLMYGVIGVILGGRLGYVLFYKPAHYLAHPAEILQIWTGGMSFHGGALWAGGAGGGVLWRAQRRRGRGGDVLGRGVPPGVGAG